MTLRPPPKPGEYRPSDETTPLTRAQIQKARGASPGFPRQPGGWYRDIAGRAQFRYYDGAQWTTHIATDGVASTDPLPLVAPVGRVRWYEPVFFILLLAIWFGGLIAVHVAVSNSVVHGQVASTQAEADRINADANSESTGAAALVGLVALAVVATRTGYRIRDALWLAIPIAGVYMLVKLLWRFACTRRHYWGVKPNLGPGMARS